MGKLRKTQVLLRTKSLIKYLEVKGRVGAQLLGSEAIPHLKTTFKSFQKRMKLRMQQHKKKTKFQIAKCLQSRE